MQEKIMFRCVCLEALCQERLAFALILVTWGIYSMNQLMENLNAMDIQELLTCRVVKYIVFMLAYMAMHVFCL